MSEPTIDPAAQTELPLGDSAYERNLLDQLLVDSKLYKSSKEFKELLDFTIRLRNMAPFNAMLLQIQKPGLNYAASAHDWKQRFQRNVKEKSRPLLILWPFGPVALVYDIIDTEGPELPKDAFAFYAAGKIDDKRIATFTDILARQNIFIKYYDQGDNDAGFIRRLSSPPPKENVYSIYELGMNRNHTVAMSFVTLAHELAHLFLGHLGDDQKLQIRERRLEHRIQEIEAESVAYIVSSRNGVASRSEKYLNSYVASDETTDDLDLYAITRAAGHIERLLHLSKSAQWIDNK